MDTTPFSTSSLANESKLGILAKMLVLETGRRMRKEKKLAWKIHKFNYSAHTQERLVC